MTDEHLTPDVLTFLARIAAVSEPLGLSKTNGGVMRFGIILLVLLGAFTLPGAARADPE